MLRRLHPEQPESFAFTPDNLEWAKGQIAKFPEGPYRSKPKPALKLPKGSHYSQVETARGLFGTYFVSTGKGDKPYRVKTRSPSFSNLSALNEMSSGLKIGDLVAILSTIDLVIPDIDR